MADKKQMDTQSKIDALYNWISYDLQKIKGELLNEMKYSAVQVGSLYRELQNDREKSSSAISQEIRYSYKQNQTIYDGLAQMLSVEVANKLQSIDEKVESLSALNEKMLSNAECIEDLKYAQLQQQAIYGELTSLLNDGVVAKLNEAHDKLDAIAKFEETLDAIHEKIAALVTLYEDNDYKALIESVSEKTEECVEKHNSKVLEAVAAIPVAENVDYNRIVDEVGDRMLEILGEVVQEEPAAPASVDAKVDYDRLIYGTAEKVVESLPYPEKVDYRRINESVQKAVNQAVEQAISAINVDAIAEAVAAKIALPAVAPATVEVDYERLADMVAERLAGKEQAAIAEVDYDRIAAIVDEKLAATAVEEEEELTYNLVLDEEGIQAIAQGVAKELCVSCVECVPCQEETVEEQPVEEVVETAEETVEEPVEEVVETVEETVEEQPVEEPVEEVVAPVDEPIVFNEEVAVSEEPIFDENGEQLVDAETGLVIRLKKSFTAKMKQSEEKVKGYYSDIKNELTSYKKVNSNVSWHGDRFNFGRDTIAKVNICGKTLCFYIALDPEDPELKSTVYHQKNVGNQKAYESTPFMVKIKSDAAAKKALRLVGYLAEKLGTEKDEAFASVDYVNEYAYQSTKQLYEEGFIKVTKEKKVELDF